MSRTGDTRILRLTQDNIDSVLQEAEAAIRRESLIIFPTDTVYGIGGAAFSPKVHNQLEALKGVRKDKPYAVLISKLEDIERFAGKPLEGEALRLAKRFWPGTLTLIWHATTEISRKYAPDNSIGFRQPAHVFLRALLKLSDGVLWATSANQSGSPPPAAFSRIKDNILEKAALAIESPEELPGVASTVVDVRTQPLKILREGAISVHEIRTFLGEEPAR